MSFSIINPLYPQRAMNRDSTAISSTTFSVTTTATNATTFTAYPAAPTQLVTFDVQTNDVYVRWDGGTPTAAAGGGHLLPAGTAYTWNVAQYNASKFIAASTASIFASPFAGG